MRISALPAAITLGVLAAVLAGCGAEPGEVSVGSGPSTSLTVTEVDEPGAAPKRWELRCDPTGGDHPAAGAACAALDRVKDPFAPVPADATCTMIYGGPQTATVKGTMNGKPVDTTFKRTDGCQIKRWDDVAPLLDGKPT